MFYPYFFVRRIFYAFILYNLDFNPLLQVSLNCLHTLIVILYLYRFRPFKISRINTFNMIQEISILACFVLSGFFINKNDPLTENILQYTIVSIISLAVVISYLAAIFEGIKGLKEQCKNNKKVSIKITHMSQSCKQANNNLVASCDAEVSRLDNDEHLEEDKSFKFMKRPYNTPNLSNAPSYSKISKINSPVASIDLDEYRFNIDEHIERDHVFKFTGRLLNTPNLSKAPSYANFDEPNSPIASVDL